MLYIFFKHINLNTVDYKYIIKSGLLECTFWNEVWASTELTEETERQDFYSMLLKQIRPCHRTAFSLSVGTRFGVVLL